MDYRYREIILQNGMIKKHKLLIDFQNFDDSCNIRTTFL